MTTDRAHRPKPILRRQTNRRGVVAVEAAMVLPLLLILMLGVWEVGRMVQVNQVMVNAAREGARVAAGGNISTGNNGVNSTDVDVALVQQAVRDYMTSAGLPSAAVSGAQISLTNLSGAGWTNPVDANPNDAFRVTVTIPSGTPFNSLKWVLASSITSMNSLSVNVTWQSANNVDITVDTALPY